jgi:hypothetical protein
MTFKELKLKIKEEQKLLAQQIKLGKPLRKPRIREQADHGSMAAYEHLWYNQADYRHRHIIYCHMFNGTPYDKIERPRDNHKPSSYQLEKIRKDWESQLDEEALRSCA